MITDTRMLIPGMKIEAYGGADHGAAAARNASRKPSMV
jgi:hypothetical protein